MALGMAVGWLLEQLVFLFDWKQIKKIRTQLRDMRYEGAVDLATAGVYAVAQALCSAGKEVAYDLARTMSAARGDVFAAIKIMVSGKSQAVPPRLRFVTALHSPAPC